MNCENCIVIESLNNAWKVLSEQYNASPHEETRQALNMLSKIVRKVRSDFEEQKKNDKCDSISVEDWLKFFNVKFEG